MSDERLSARGRLGGKDVPVGDGRVLRSFPLDVAAIPKGRLVEMSLTPRQVVRPGFNYVTYLLEVIKNNVARGSLSPNKSEDLLAGWIGLPLDLEEIGALVQRGTDRTDEKAMVLPLFGEIPLPGQEKWTTDPNLYPALLLYGSEAFFRTGVRLDGTRTLIPGLRPRILHLYIPSIAVVPTS